jgi:hypothetical protein
MAINRWRQIGYADDGCYAYQCLACAGGFVVRGDAERWAFCPLCGVRWEGERIAGREERPYRAPPAPSSFWLIETRRQTWQEGEDGTPTSPWGRWELCRILDPRHPARDVLALLHRLRAEASDPPPMFGRMPDEYRVRTGPMPHGAGTSGSMYHRYYG